MDKIILLPLTETQRNTLNCIIKFIDLYKYPPTIHEIMKEVVLTNPGVVYKVLMALEKKGYITKNKNENRGTRLTDLTIEHYKND